MEYELDGIYMLRQKDYERTDKVKGLMVYWLHNRLVVIPSRYFLQHLMAG